MKTTHELEMQKEIDELKMENQQLKQQLATLKKDNVRIMV